MCCCPGDGAEAPPPHRWRGGRVSVGSETGVQRSHEEPALLHPASRFTQRSQVTTHTADHRLNKRQYFYCESVVFVSCADVERYSDKYHGSEQSERLMDWTPGETLINTSENYRAAITNQ